MTAGEYLSVEMRSAVDRLAVLSSFELLLVMAALCLLCSVRRMNGHLHLLPDGFRQQMVENPTPVPHLELDTPRWNKVRRIAVRIRRQQLEMMALRAEVPLLALYTVEEQEWHTAMASFELQLVRLHRCCCQWSHSEGVVARSE
jgi:hypothetical protein